MEPVAVSRRCRKSHSILATGSAFLSPFHCVGCGHDSQENGRNYGHAHSVTPCGSETSEEAHDEDVRNEHTDD